MEAKEKSSEMRILWLLVIVHSFILYYICDFSKTLETYGDEAIYFNIAKCLAEGRTFTWHGMELSFTNIAYPLLISLFVGIKDVVLRVHLITAFNAFLMSLSIIPVWLICRELQVSRKIRYLIIFIVMIYPSMAMAATFMSENLYWPLTLWAYYFILRIIKHGKVTDAFAAGTLSFLCYFCKEVGVCIFLSVTIWFFISPVDSYWSERKHLEDDKKQFTKYYANHFEWKNLLAYVSIYAVVYLIVNKLFLSGVINGYGGVTSSVSSFMEIIDLSKIIYIIYAVILYTVYVLIAFFVVPAIYPMMNLNEMNHTTRKVYFYSLIILMGTILTIVCKISVKEDFGKIVPRVHMRYLSSMLGLILPIYGSVISDEKQKSGHRKLWMFLGIFFLFAVFIFKGAVRGSAVDSLELGYAVYLHGKCGVMNIGELNVYTAGIVCSAFFGIVIVIGYFAGKRKMRYAYYCFYVAAVLACILNFQKGFEIIKNGYSAPESYINDMKRINDYFIDNDLEDKSVLYVCKEWYAKRPKVYDTYFVGRKTYEVGYGTLLDLLKNTSENSISDYDFTNPVKEKPFQMNYVDYFICDFREFQGLVGNVEYLEDISSENYFVYKNTQPTEICYLNPTNIVDFTGNAYSTMTYSIEGISVPEGTFSWTDGNELSMSCDFSEEIERVKAQINIVGTYNGTQNFTVYQNDTAVSQGSISGSGQIVVDLAVDEGTCSFKIDLPNAVSPYALGMSEDKRVLALQISSMEFLAEE